MTQCTSATSGSGGASVPLGPLLSPGWAAVTEGGGGGVGTQGKGDCFSGKSGICSCL